MDWDDEKPRTTKAVTIGEVLEALSIDELNARIEALDLETVRIKKEIAARKAHEATAQSIFKS